MALLTELLHVLSPLLVPINLYTVPVFALELHERICNLNKLIEFISTILRPEPNFDDILLFRAYRYSEDETLKIVISRFSERISRLEIFLDVIANCKIAAFLNPDIEDKNAVLDGIKATAITVTETATESTATLGIETAAQVLGQASIGVGITVLIDLALTSRSLYMAKKQKDDGIISEKEFSTKVKKKVCESGLQFVGGTTGSIVGQILIPIPVLGAFVGGLCGSLIGTGIGKGINYGIFDKWEKEAEIFSKTSPSALVGSQLAVLEDVVSKKRRKNLTKLIRYNEQIGNFEEINLQQAFSFLDRILKSYDVSAKKTTKSTSSPSFFSFNKSSEKKIKIEDDDTNQVINEADIKDSSNAQKGTGNYSFFSFGKFVDKNKSRDISEDDEFSANVEETAKETSELSSSGSSFFSFGRFGGKQKKKDDEKFKDVCTMEQQTSCEAVEVKDSDDIVEKKAKGSSLEDSDSLDFVTPPQSPTFDKTDSETKKRAGTPSHISSLKSLLTFDFSSKDLQRQPPETADVKTEKISEDPKRRHLTKRFTLSGINQFTQVKDTDSPKSPILLEPEEEVESPIKRNLRSPTRQRSLKSPTNSKTPEKEPCMSPKSTESDKNQTEEHVSRILISLQKTAAQREKEKEREKETELSENSKSEDYSAGFNSKGEKQMEGDSEGKDVPFGSEKKSFRSSLFFEESLGSLFGNLNWKDGRRKKDTSPTPSDKQEDKMETTEHTEQNIDNEKPIDSQLTEPKWTEQDKLEQESSSNSGRSRFDYLFTRRSQRQRVVDRPSSKEEQKPESQYCNITPTVSRGEDTSVSETQEKSPKTKDSADAQSELRGKEDETFKTSISEGLEKFFGFKGKGRSKTESSLELKGVVINPEKTRTASPKVPLNRSNSERRGLSGNDVSRLTRSKSERICLRNDQGKCCTTSDLSAEIGSRKITGYTSASEIEFHSAVFEEEEEEEGYNLEHIDKGLCSQNSAQANSKEYLNLYQNKVQSVPENLDEKLIDSSDITPSSFDESKLSGRPQLNRNTNVQESLHYDLEWKVKRSHNLKRQQPFMDVCLSPSALSDSSSKEDSGGEYENDEESSLPFMDIAPVCSKSNPTKEAVGIATSQRSYTSVTNATNNEHWAGNHQNQTDYNNSFADLDSAKSEPDLKERLLSWVFTKPKDEKEGGKIEGKGSGELKRAQTMKSRPNKFNQNDGEGSRKRNSSLSMFDFRTFESEEKLADQEIPASPAMKPQVQKSPRHQSADVFPEEEPLIKEPEKSASTGTPKKSTDFSNLVKALTIFKLPTRKTDDENAKKEDSDTAKDKGDAETMQEQVKETTNPTEQNTEQVRSKLKEKQRLIDKIGIFRIAKRDRNSEETSG